MFERAIAYTDLVKELTIIPHITEPDDIEPGEYWLGPLEALFPETSDDFSLYHLIPEALGEAEAKTGLDVQGVTITWGNHKLEFLSAPVGYMSRFAAHSSDESVISVSGGNEFSARTYFVFASVSDVCAYAGDGSDLDAGVRVSVHETVTPVTSLNSIHFTRFTGEVRKTVCDVFAK